MSPVLTVISNCSFFKAQISLTYFFRSVLIMSALKYIQNSNLNNSDDAVAKT